MNFLLADAVAAVVILKLDSFLQRHHQITGLMIEVEEVALVMNLVYMLPSSPRMWFQERREANIFEHIFPFQRIMQIAEGLRCRFGRMFV